MRTVSPLDLRRRLGQILDAASAGERFVIERDHRPLAMLVSVDDGRRLDESEQERRRRALAALEDLERWTERMGQLHPGLSDEPNAVEALRLEREERLTRLDEAAARGQESDQSDGGMVD